MELLLERAATVTEMAQAVGRPKSTVAYHVNLLVDVGLLRAVRTRQVRVMPERHYGRVARTVYIGLLNRPEDKQVVAAINGLAQGAAESAAAHATDELRCTLVHARIPIEEVRNFWAQVQQVARRFAQIPRGGGQVYGFTAGLYPTDAPPSPTPSGARPNNATDAHLRAEGTGLRPPGGKGGRVSATVRSQLGSPPTAGSAGENAKGQLAIRSRVQDVPVTDRQRDGVPLDLRLVGGGRRAVQAGVCW